MYGIIVLVVVALVSLLITRVAAIALAGTGMTRTAARFQARSALSGVGFTTSEAESVVNHPVRRRIIMGLMLAGNVGLVTAVAGLIGGFVQTSDAAEAALRGGLLIGGLVAVYLLSKSQFVDERITRATSHLLQRYTDLDVRDYAALLHVAGDYGVKELQARPGGWLDGRTLGELRLRDEGVTVLGVVCADGDYIGVPSGDTPISAGDTVILYGRSEVITEIGKRPTGHVGERQHDRRAREEPEATRSPGSRDRASGDRPSGRRT